MNVFDMVGPVMIGPSSSHTAGVVRIGNMGRKILGEAPGSVRIRFHGSFSTTYQGHGSDKAVIAGLMGFHTYDEEIRDSLTLAAQAGIEYTFETVTLKNAHPNTVVIEAQSRSGEHLHLTGVSVGGGNILVTEINGIDVRLDGQYDTFMIHHTDQPGVIAMVTKVFSDLGINIAKMNVYRSRKGGDAIMIIETDGNVEPSVAEALTQIPSVDQAVYFANIMTNIN